MKKKMLALLTGVMLLCSSLPVSLVAEAEAEPMDISGVVKSFEKNLSVLSLDFEHSSDLSRLSSQVPTIQAAPNRHGKALNKLMSPNNPYIALGESVDSGLTLISFDFMIPDAEAGKLFYLRLFGPGFTAVNAENTGYMAETFWFEMSAGDAGIYANCAGWTRTPSSRLSFGQWHNVCVWLDMDMKTVYFTVDNEYLGSTGANATKVPALEGLIFSSTASATWLDNINVTKLNRNTLSAVAEQGANVPEALFQRYFLTAKIGGVGNVTDEQDAGKPIDAVLNISSIDEEERILTVDMTVKTEDNTTLFTKTREVTAAANADTELVQTLPGVSEYGFYYLYVTLTDKSTGEVVCRDVTDFSLVRLPEPGTRNPRLGITLHERAARMGDPFINLEFVDKAGFSSTRSDHTWSRYERAMGVYNMTDAYKALIDAKKEKGIGHLEILAYSNSLYGNDSPPSTEQSFKGYINYSLQFIKELKERMGSEGDLEIEMWNEYNNPPMFNADNRPPEMYAELVKRTYPALKEAYPDLFAWGMTPVGTAHTRGGWIERVLAAGGGEYMDGIAVHPYTNASTPEGGGVIGNITQLKEIMAEYGVGDKPLRATEWGWPSRGVNGMPDRMHQASYFVRANVIDIANNLFEKVDWYTINDGGEDMSSNENHYGLLRGKDTHVPYGAKPSYLAATTYNDLMSEAEYRDSLQIGEDVTAYRFKLKDGRDCVTAWKVEDGAEVAAMNLGTEEVTLIDMYGNEKLLHSVDGAFQIAYTAMPVYLVGSFDGFEKAEKAFDLSAWNLEIPDGGNAALRLAQYSGDKGTVEVFGNDDITLQEETGFFGDINKLIFTSTGKGAETLVESGWDLGTSMNISTRSGSVDLTVKDSDGNPIFYHTAEVVYSPKVSVEVSLKPKSLAEADSWEAVFTLTNISYGEVADGVIEIQSPAALAGKRISFQGLNAGQTRQLRMNLPVSAIVDNTVSLGAEVELDSGYRSSVSKEITPNVCAYMEKPPTIDGKMESGEWNLNSAADLNDGSYVYLAGENYRGADDLSGKLYMAWDEENFYLCAAITDDVFAYDQLEGGILWRSDGIQFAMSPYRGSSTIAQFDIAQIDGKNLVQVDRSPDSSLVGMLDPANYELEIGREGTVTTYELKMPWTVIFPQGYKVEKNGELAMTFLVNENDGSVRRGYYEYGSGMGSGSANSARYNDFYMLGKALIEELD